MAKKFMDESDLTTFVGLAKKDIEAAKSSGSTAESTAEAANTAAQAAQQKADANEQKITDLTGRVGTLETEQETTDSRLESLENGQDNYLAKTGGTMTGDITMSEGKTVKGVPAPVEKTDAANKEYVDGAKFDPSTLQAAVEQAQSTADGAMPKSGGTFTGSVTMSPGAKLTGVNTPEGETDATNKQYVDGEVAKMLPLSGGIMTGPINMSAQKITNLADPVDDGDAVPKRWLGVTPSISGASPINFKHFTTMFTTTINSTTVTIPLVARYCAVQLILPYGGRDTRSYGGIDNGTGTIISNSNPDFRVTLKSNQLEIYVVSEDAGKPVFVEVWYA